MDCYFIVLGEEAFKSGFIITKQCAVQDGVIFPSSTRNLSRGFCSPTRTKYILMKETSLLLGRQKVFARFLKRVLGSSYEHFPCLQKTMAN